MEIVEHAFDRPSICLEYPVARFWWCLAVRRLLFLTGGDGRGDAAGPFEEIGCATFRGRELSSLDQYPAGEPVRVVGFASTRLMALAGVESERFLWVDLERGRVQTHEQLGRERPHPTLLHHALEAFCPDDHHFLESAATGRLTLYRTPESGRGSRPSAVRTIPSLRAGGRIEVSHWIDENRVALHERPGEAEPLEDAERLVHEVVRVVDVRRGDIVPSARGAFPVSSWDGRWLLYLRREGAPPADTATLLLRNLSSEEHRDRTVCAYETHWEAQQAVAFFGSRPGREGIWSPDSRQLLYPRGGGLRMQNVAGNLDWDVLPLVPAVARISPQGDWLAYDGDRDASGRYRLEFRRLS